ncbi:MAG: hypothetical protein D6706_18375, partial [Chloroflexi bacterium]
DMESGGTTYLDTGVGGTSYNCTFDGSGSCQNAPENTDLYWSVRPIINNKPAGNWATPRRFRIDTSGGSSCNNPGPNNDQIGLYEQANYCGNYKMLGVGEYANPGAMGFANDSASSIKVGNNVKALLCKDDNYGGDCEWFTGDDPDLSNNSIGNNQVSSVKVESKWGNCNPGADQIALFVDGNYGGQCVVKGIGNYSNPGAIGLPNDSISSVKVGSNVQAILCRDDNYGGGCETFISNDSNLSDNSIGNDQVSSVKVESISGGCNPDASQVALYANTSYVGNCVILGVGNYPTPGSLGSVGNDNAESIRVGSNVKATLCEHDNYQGRCEPFTGDDINLGDNYIGGNVVSSVKVESRVQAPGTPVLQSP